MPPATFDLAHAYEFCARLARSHYENFTIASWLMPRAMRPHMHAIYAYARMADDFADEEHDLAKLDGWEHELDLAYAGTPRHPVFVALADTVSRFDIPRQPFADLLRAFRSDVDFKGFETLDDLLGYARYSANPVGRLVLYLFGFRDAERQQLSDLRLHRTATREFLAGRRDRSGQRIGFICRVADLARFGLRRRISRGAVNRRAFVALMRHEVASSRADAARGAELASLSWTAAAPRYPDVRRRRAGDPARDRTRRLRRFPIASETDQTRLHAAGMGCA